VLLQRLQRWRVRLGFISAVAVLALARPTVRSLLVGAAIAATGEAVRIWAAGHLEKSREVTKSGPYRLSRHPLYVGSSVMGVGLAVAANAWVPALLVGAYLAATLTAAIRNEESYLRRMFGGEYEGYATGAVDRRRRFSVSRAVRNREYRSVAGLVVIIGLLALKLAW
jgi:protein-S-isoprenylcysteine O-methyltransferase Ste14